MSEDLKTSCGVEIHDKLRLVSADGPAVKLEGGQQKGGNYYCLCGVHADYACDIETAYRCTLKSLEEHRQMVFNGPVGHRNSMAGKIKPFENLNAAQLMEELMGRGILRKEILKKDTQSHLTEELCAIQWIPSMLITTPGDELDSLNLQDYEIFPHEGMHDVAGHTENLFEELPMHVKDDKHLTTPNHRRCSVKQPVKANEKSKRKVLNIKNRLQNGISKKRNFKGMHAKSTKGKKSELYNKFKQTIDSFDHKEVKRCVDYRKALLRVTHLLRNDLSNDMYMILWTLAEIQEHLYMGEEERCPRNVLRLHNLAFMHNIILDSVVQMPLTMTNRKFRGKYVHNLVIHAPVQNRIVAGATTHVESKERAFNASKSITANMSSNRPEHIIGNLLVRLQIEKHKSQTSSNVAREINEISELSRLIEEIPNTFIPYAFIKSNPGKWKAHLERISDFLLPRENIWWEQRMDGVVFHDSKSGPTARSEGPLLHHFWSSNLLAEQIYLRKCWNDCVEKKIPIPTKQFLRELKAEISQSETIVSSANSTSTGIQRAKEKTECGIDSDENNEDQEIVLDIEPVHEEDEAENTVPDDVNEGSSEIHVSPSEAIEITGRVKVVPCIELDETPPLTSCSDSTNSSLSIKNQHGKDTVSADGNLQDITFIPNVTSTPVAASKKQCRRKPCDAEQRNTSKLGI